jgi:hypothetical protein
MTERAARVTMLTSERCGGKQSQLEFGLTSSDSDGDVFEPAGGHSASQLGKLGGHWVENFKYLDGDRANSLAQERSSVLRLGRNDTNVCPDQVANLAGKRFVHKGEPTELLLPGIQLISFSTLNDVCHQFKW